jgi:hypothetical protein
LEVALAKHVLDQRLDIGDITAMLLYLTADVDLDQDGLKSTGLLGSAVQFVSQGIAIQGVDQLESPDDLLGLVGLERADQVEAEILRDGVGELSEGVLDAVLSKVTLAGSIGGVYDFSANRLADGDQRDLAGVMPSAACGSSDGLLDQSQALGDSLLQRCRSGGHTKASPPRVGDS